MSAEFWWISRRSSTLYLGLVASGIWGILPCSNYKIDHDLMCVMRKKLDTSTRCGAILISIQRRYSCNPDVDAIQMLCAIDVLVQS